MTDYKKPLSHTDLMRTHLIFDVNFCIGITNDFLLNYRFFLFENLLLKSLDNQTTKNFTLNLNIDVSWPIFYKQKLLAIKNKVNFQILISEVDNIKHISNPLNKIQASKYDYVGILRIDDDDLISNAYTENVAKVTASIFNSFANKSYLFFYSSEGFLYFPDSNTYGPINCYKFPLAIGIGFVNRVGAPLKYVGTHTEIFTSLDKSHDVDCYDLGSIERSWIYTKHKQSDSTTEVQYNSLMDNFTVGIADAAVFRNFGLSADDLNLINNFVKNSPSSNYFKNGGKKRIVKLWEIDVPLSTENHGSEVYKSLLQRRRDLEKDE